MAYLLTTYLLTYLIALCSSQHDGLPTDYLPTYLLNRALLLSARRLARWLLTYVRTYVLAYLLTYLLTYLLQHDGWPAAADTQGR